MAAMTDEYVLGTDDVEVKRLEHQHGVWRTAARDAWQRAGIAPGHTVLDLGCGPGFATRDLAALVGPAGHVHALDKSRRFLDLVDGYQLPTVATHLVDLDRDELPVADAAWARWAFCFLARPRDLVTRVARALKPGGVLVLHEYFDYGTWRATPTAPDVEAFVAAVMASWRAQGGEPDIALPLLPWLREAGFAITSLRPIVDVVPPGTPKWSWLTSFGTSGIARLVELGQLTPARGAAIAATWAALAAQPGVHLVTPSLLEIIATRT